MKKILLLLCLLLTVSLACAEQHVCAPGGLVDMDLNERWDLCECGKKLNVTQHVWETDDWGDQLCSSCGAQLFFWEDGSLELCGVDAQDSVIRQLGWNAEGDLVTNLSTVYEYDAEGHMAYAWYYEADVLYAESAFALDADGYETEVLSVVYYDDGSMSVSEYNLMGDQTMASYYYDGELESTLRFDYTYNAEGVITRMRTFSEDALIEEADYVVMTVGDEIHHYPARLTAWFEDDSRIVYVNDINGDTLIESHYDAAGNLVLTLEFDTEYDADGNLLRVTTTQDGVLAMVEEYALDADGWTYLAVETAYEADGTQTVTRYDENGEMIN